MEQHPDSSFSPSHLDSAAYRERLKRKLSCLIAVLEVANAKVRRSLAAPEADVERLTRIKKNLQDTLDVCLKARLALEKRGCLPPELSADLSKAVDTRFAEGEAFAAQTSGRRLRTAAERARLARLGPIRPEMVLRCDLDQLAARLALG